MLKHINYRRGSLNLFLDLGLFENFARTNVDISEHGSIQIKAARLVFSASKRDSSTSLLHSLHWLTVCEIIFLKLCMFTNHLMVMLHSI